MLGLALVVLLNASPTIQPKARGAFLDTASIAGASALKAGDHLDVIAVFTDAETKSVTAVTLLQNVVVVSSEPAHFALLVLPEEAEALAVAKASGQLMVTLRNAEDTNVLAERRRVTMKALLKSAK